MTSIFFVHLFNDFSGSPRVLRDAIEAVCSDSEYDVHIVTSGGDGFLSNAKAQYHSIHYCTHPNKYVQLIRYLFSQVLLFFCLSWLLVKRRILGDRTIVIVNTLLPFAAHLSAKLFSNYNIAYIHETYIKPKLLMNFLRLVVSLCSDKQLYVSKYVRDAINIENVTSLVLYNGLRGDFDFNYVDSQAKFYGRQILFVGSLKEYKGIFSFVKLAKLLPEYNFVAVLNASEKEFIDFTDKVAIRNITCYRNPDNIAGIYMDAMVVINLSDPNCCVETFGLTLLEGLSFGTPVIAPPHGGPLEFIDDSVGALIEPCELDEIVSYIKNLSNDFSTWCAMSIQCLKRAEQFSQVNYRKAFIKILKENI